MPWDLKGRISPAGGLALGLLVSSGVWAAGSREARWQRWLGRLGGGTEPC